MGIKTTSSLKIIARALLGANETMLSLSFASISQPAGAAFLSRSSARVELYLLLTVHSFTPSFRKEVDAKL